MNQEQHAKRIIDISVRSMDEISEFLTEGMEREPNDARLLLKILRGRMEMCRYSALTIARSVEDRQEADANNERFRRTDGE